MFCPIEDDDGTSSDEESHDEETCTSTNESLTHLRSLFEEFESLGICDNSPNIENEFVYTDLIVNTHKLVNIHRKSIAQLREKNTNIAKLKSETLRLEKQADGFRKTIAEHEADVEALKHKLRMTEMECQDLQKDKRDLQVQLLCTKKFVSTKDDQWEHKIKQLQLENQKLKNSSEKNIGTFLSQDEVIASVIQKYKTNEEYYKQTIATIEGNQRMLITQLLDLVATKEKQDADL